MKLLFVSILLAALLATAVQAAPAAEPFKINRWCRFPGQVCGKAKRAAIAIESVKSSVDAVADAMAFLDELTPEYAQLANDFGQLKEESDNSEE
ncbi:hypothetical protein BDV11DRAFT_191601 [Aspergillus similis]